MPWLLELRDRACIGERVVVYNLARITLGERVTVAQEAYLCGGSHDLSDQNLPLTVGEIRIDDDAFVGARAFILPGIRIEKLAVVGACAVVTKDVMESTMVAGNPAKLVGVREFRHA